MKRASDMAARLPTLYREGELSLALLTQPALQVEILEVHLLEVQRAHFFDDALELEEAAGLGALLDFEPEPWQNLGLYRAWVHAQRFAVLEKGALTPDALRGFAEDYASGHEDATGVRFARATPRLVENPARRRVLQVPASGDLVPLAQWSLDMRGLDETHVSLLLTGLESGPESVPLIVNLTTGEGLVFLGNVAPGERLALRALPDGSVLGLLEGRDVSERLRSVSGVVPGQAWGAPEVSAPARALRLARGENRLWFLPVAHYDLPGLDRFLLGLAELGLAQARWDEARLDSALFHQDAAVKLLATWLEAEPASLELELPTQSLRRRALDGGNPEDVREDFRRAIDLGVGRLRAAGVESAVRALSFSEVQGQFDTIAAVLPLRLKEAGSSGADRMPDAGGLFGVTGYGDSTFR